MSKFEGQVADRKPTRYTVSPEIGGSYGGKKFQSPHAIRQQEDVHWAFAEFQTRQQKRKARLEKISRAGPLMGARRPLALIDRGNCS
jgi:hypothetical protein